MSLSVLAYNMKRMIQIMGIPMLIQAIGPDSFIPPRRYRHMTAVMKTRFRQPRPIRTYIYIMSAPTGLGTRCRSRPAPLGQETSI